MGRESPKLTSKQELFVQGLISGKSQRQAYIDAGYSTKNKKPEYIDQRASHLFKNSKVIARYEELNSKVIKKAEEKCLFSFERLIGEWEECLADSKLDRNYTGRTKALTELTTLFDYYPKEDAVNVDDPIYLAKILKRMPKKKLEVLMDEFSKDD